MAAMRNVQRALDLTPTDADVRFRAAMSTIILEIRSAPYAFLEKAIAAGYPATAIRDTLISPSP